jgi:hypothetical protein
MNITKNETCIRVVQSCHLLATYHVTYFTTYLIRRTRRRAISGIMNFVDAYSQAPTYCLCLSGCLFGNPNSGCSPDLFSLTCLLFPCVVVPSLIIASLIFSHSPPCSDMEELRSGIGRWWASDGEESPECHDNP